MLRDGTFCGCGVLIEPGLVLTCAHVLRDALAEVNEVWVRLPFVSVEGKQFSVQADIVFNGFAGGRPQLDVALLKPKTAVPEFVPRLQLALEQNLEQGEAVVLAYLESRGIDDEIKGNLSDHINGKGNRKFTAAAANGYFVEHGSSGSPAFLRNGQQVAGILVQAEQTEAPQTGEIKEGFVISASQIRPVLDAISPAPELKNLSPLPKRRLPNERARPVLPARPADLERFPPASGSVAATQPRQGSDEGRETYEIVARVTFRGPMRALVDAGEIVFGYPMPNWQSPASMDG